MANLKAHIMAVAVMAVVVVAGVMLFAPDKEALNKNANDDSYFIQIYSASFGGNCNGSEEYKKPDENGVREKVTVKVKRNNRLGRVSELCNEETSCVFDVSNSVLGRVQTYDCKPALEVKYRCFRVDRLQTSNVTKGDEMKIDCRPATVEKRMGKKDSKETP